MSEQPPIRRADEIEARRKAYVDALSIRNRTARWWSIHGLPLLVTVGIALLALFALYAYLEWWA